MEYSLRSIHLYSSQQDGLVHFLSNLFEMDVEAGLEKSYLHGDGLSFCIHPEQQMSLSLEERKMAIELSVHSQEELDNLRRKIEFIHYRDNDQNELRMSLGEGCLEFYDLDNRLWIVTVCH